MSGYENVVGGKLKRGRHSMSRLLASRRRKRKRKRNRFLSLLKLILSLSPAASNPSLVCISLFAGQVDLHKFQLILMRAMPTNSARKEKRLPIYDHQMTPAERRYIEQRERINTHRLAKTANKSHRDRIQSVSGKYEKEVGKPVIVVLCGSLVYYHCAYRNSSLLSLFSDVLIVLLCSLAILGLLFRQLNISVPVDPIEWQISQETANSIIACLANTVGAAESVLRVAATGHDKRLFLKVVVSLYILSALGRLVSGVTVAYAGLCLFCLYMLAENSQSIRSCLSRFLGRNGATTEND